MVASAAFKGKTRVQQHQMVYDALGGRMGGELHALSLQTSVKELGTMGDEDAIRGAFLPGLPIERIRACYEAAPGNEFLSRKFFSAESSAALVANAFGYFIGQADELPPLPGTDHLDWPARAVTLEKCLRFPWAGGRHPYLDVVVETTNCLIGVESKRFEPFRGKPEVELSDAYRRDVWGSSMRHFEATRDDLRDGNLSYEHLDACQLVKHAFGLRTQANEAEPAVKPILFYLYAEPSHWSDGRAVEATAAARHREEVNDFAGRVADDEVMFFSCDYKMLLAGWRRMGGVVANHADAVMGRFAP
jgi:hypothetical protein